MFKALTVMSFLFLQKFSSKKRAQFSKELIFYALKSVKKCSKVYYDILIFSKAFIRDPQSQDILVCKKHMVLPLCFHVPNAVSVLVVLCSLAGGHLALAAIGQVAARFTALDLHSGTRINNT